MSLIKIVNLRKLVNLIIFVIPAILVMIVLIVNSIDPGCLLLHCDLA